MLINYLLMLILMFMSIAFFTIMERKLLGSIHIRLGPNKLGVGGILQPFSDALKLFSKSINFISKTNESFWNISPILLFIMMMLMFDIFPIKMMNSILSFSLLFFLLFLGMTIYPLFFSSFFSFSKYSLISSKRSVCQMVSYEMGFTLMFIMMLLITMKSDLELLSINEDYYYYNKFILYLLTYMLILCESSRIPFDFIEGESELVSGFNTEYSSSYFSMFFIFEYGMMLFLSMMFSLMLNMMLLLSMLIMLFILFRSSFPRMRYDQMMVIFWKYFLLIFSSIFMIL